MKTNILGLMVVAVFFISTVTVAQPFANPQKGDMPDSRKAMMIKKQNKEQNNRPDFLTEEQKEQAKTMRIETAKKLKPLKNELNELKAHQQTLTTADKADMKAINLNIDKISAIKTEIAKIRAAQHQKFRAMLSDEQLVRIDSMKEKQGRKGGLQRMKNNQKGANRAQRG